jgi:hypothetical protein
MSDASHSESCSPHSSDHEYDSDVSVSELASEVPVVEDQCASLSGNVLRLMKVLNAHDLEQANSEFTQIKEETHPRLREVVDKRRERERIARAKLEVVKRDIERRFDVARDTQIAQFKVERGV